MATNRLFPGLPNSIVTLFPGNNKNLQSCSYMPEMPIFDKFDYRKRWACPSDYCWFPHSQKRTRSPIRQGRRRRYRGMVTAPTRIIRGEMYWNSVTRKLYVRSTQFIFRAWLTSNIASCAVPSEIMDYHTYLSVPPTLHQQPS